MGRLGYVRDLFVHLVSVELRLLYQGSGLGIAWTLVNPIIQLIVFSLIFTRVLRVEVPQYPLFLCCGLLCWNAFSESLTMAAGSIVKSRNVLYQPGFPPFMMPLVVVMLGLIHLVFSFSILAVLMMYYRVSPGWSALALPLLMGVQFLLTLAFAFPLAALQVRFQDVGRLLAVAFRFLFFLTPILYTTDGLSRLFRLFYAANPLTHLIDGYRSILMNGGWPNWSALSLIAGFALIALIIGFRYFEARRFQFIEDL
jgi:lipopolysaccharide transport system permease protein